VTERDFASNQQLHPSRAFASKPIRRRRDRPPRETAEIIDNAASFVRGLGRRLAQGDPDDLARLRRVREALDQTWIVAVAGLRKQGFSDQEIATALGVTRQAVEKKWPRDSR
jgi:hypothetical protein